MANENIMQPIDFGHPLGVANGCVTVTPSDTNYIAHPSSRSQFVGKYLTCRAFRVYTTAGDVAVETPDGSTALYHAVAVGQVIEQLFVRVLDTGTDAVGIEAIY